MTFRTSCYPFINKYGTINQTPGELEQNSGNSLLYFGDYHRILDTIQEPYSNAEDDFKNSVRKYYVAGCPGLLNRYPGNQTIRESYDDYVGVLSAASVRSKVIACEILLYLKTHLFNADNVNPFKIDFYDLIGQNELARFPGFEAHAHYAAGFKPRLFWRAYWIFKILENTFSNKAGTSDTRISWHYVKTFETFISELNPTRFKFLEYLRFPFSKLSVKIWKKRLAKKYPGLMGDVFKEYFKDVTDHPYGIFMKDRI